MQIDKAAWKYHLTRAQVTQRDVAVALGVNPTALSNIIAGRRPLSPDLAAQLAAALGVELKQLMVRP